jgi:SOS-response transcriptional repressor LexA
MNNFGERLILIRDSLGVKNQTKFAEKIGITQTSLSKYENGTVDIPDDVKLKISGFGINLHWLLTGEGEMFLSSRERSLENTQKTGGGYKVPLLSQKVSCGEGVNWLDEQNVKGFLDIFSWIPRRMVGRIYAFSVEGNSMVGAGIKNGDYVLFSAEEDQRLIDDIYVFSLDNEVFCKQLEFDRILNRIKIYSLRVADIEKAELLRTINAGDADFADRFHLFGRVFSWIHPNYED